MEYLHLKMYLRVTIILINVNAIFLICTTDSRTMTENPKDLVPTSFKSAIILENLLTYFIYLNIHRRIRLNNFIEFTC